MPKCLSITQIYCFLLLCQVFKRERLNGHYGITAFLISNIFSAVPYNFLMSIIPGAVVTYLSGLHKGVDNFVFLISVLFATVTWVESLMMVVGSVFPNYVMGVIVCGGIEGVMILTSGFYRLPNDLPKPVWKFPFYYISFLTYAFQGLLKNEFEDLPFSSEVLADTWHVQMGHSKWVDLAIMFAMIVLYRVLFLAISKCKEKSKQVSVGIKPETKIFSRINISELQMRGIDDHNAV